MSRRGRHSMLLAAALAAAVVGLLAVLCWPRLLEGYYLFKLHRDPALLEDFLLADEGEKERAAAAFARDPEGKAALFKLYIEEFDKTEPGFTVREYLRRLRDSPYVEGTLALWENGATLDTLSPPSGRHTFSHASLPTKPKRRTRILALLDSCAGESFRLEAFEGFEFHLARLVDGEAVAPAWRKSQTITPTPRYPGLRYVCFFRLGAKSQ